MEYCIRRSSAPITNDMPSTKRNNRMASKTSRTVSGRQRSSSSINTTTFSTLLLFSRSLNSFRKFLISVRVLSFFFSILRISSMSFACTSPALDLMVESKLLSDKSVNIPIPPDRNKSNPYLTPFPKILLISIFFISSFA